jgi:D-glucosaminate-6-phosphate ammonia-lyase
VWVPEVANHVPHIRVSLPADKKAADVVKAMRDGEPSIAIRNEEEQLVMSTWMMRSGEDKIVAKRLKQVLEGKTS